MADLVLDDKPFPLIMGIVNLTPDSFWSGSRTVDPAAAVAQARRFITEGADLLDIGAESTRPGAAPVSEAEEMARLWPVLDQLLPECPVPVSVDTWKARVAQGALDRGVSMINDITAGSREPALLKVVAASKAWICLMHMRGTPAAMQHNTTYDDLVAEVHNFLTARRNAAVAAGISPRRIIVDPGIGFGKSAEGNLTLLKNFGQYGTISPYVLVGVSRKSFIGAVTGAAVEDRLPGSLAAAACAVVRGARLVRVHDVAATRQFFAIWRGIATETDSDR